jgi:uncharacterized protein (TIGR02453 family)
MSKIFASNLEFLRLIKENNQRDWFNAQKERFLREQSQVELFADALLGELQKHDVLETQSGKKSLHRIYRDTRFSKEKTPYKTHWGGGFTRASKFRRGGYYYHIESGNSFVVGGFWGPVASDLKLIREDIAFDAEPLRKILSNKDFVNTFGALQGEQLKLMPKGYSASHPDIDLLRYKQFLLIKNFSDAEVLSDGFVLQVNHTYKLMRPFFDYMSQVLSSDVNGEEI